MIFSPLPLVALPLIAAALTALLRRWGTLSALIAALFPAAAAVLAIVNPLSSPLHFLGRDLYLTTPDRYALIFLYLCASATFLGVWRTTGKWTYYTVALAALAAIAAALGARPVIVEVIGGRPFDPFNYAVLFFTVGAVLTIFPLQGGQPGVTIGTLRYLTFMVIAVPVFLAAAWILDQYSQSPDAVNLAQTATGIGVRETRRILEQRAPTLEVDGEMHGDAALSEAIRRRERPTLPGALLPGRARGRCGPSRRPESKPPGPLPTCRDPWTVPARP